LQPPNRHLDDVSPREKEAILRHTAAIDGKVAGLNQQIAALRGPTEKRLFEARLAGLPGAIRDDVRTALATAPAKRSAVQKYLAEKLGQGLKVAPQEVDRGVSTTDRAALGRLRGEIASLNGRRRSVGKIQALAEVGPPPATYLLRRGDHRTPG